MGSKANLVTAFILALMVVVSSCGQSQPPEVSPPQEEGEFRVEVSRNGFNGTPGETRPLPPWLWG